MPPHPKEIYEQKTGTRLKKIKTRVITLEKQIQKTEADIKVRHEQKMSQIRGYYAQTKEKLEELRKSTQGTWLDHKTALDEALDVLDEAVDVMSRRISAKPKN